MCLHSDLRQDMLTTSGNKKAWTSGYSIHSYSHSSILTIFPCALISVSPYIHSFIPMLSPLLQSNCFHPILFLYFIPSLPNTIMILIPILSFSHILRMLPYGALSTGSRVGFIEVVRKSETIANIQKLEKANAGKRIGLWDSHLLYAWLEKKNVVEQQCVD